MKKIILLAGIVVLLMQTGCSDGNGSAHKVIASDPDISLVEVDGCQYVLYHNGAGRSITHHENCPNPKHQQK